MVEASSKVLPGFSYDVYQMKSTLKIKEQQLPCRAFGSLDLNLAKVEKLLSRILKSLQEIGVSYPNPILLAPNPLLKMSKTKENFVIQRSSHSSIPKPIKTYRPTSCPCSPKKINTLSIHILQYARQHKPCLCLHMMTTSTA